MKLTTYPIIQMAFVVHDYKSAVERWVTTNGAGPFFLLDHSSMINPLYRGQRSKAEYLVALGYCGDIQVEFIQPTNDAPSIYRETLDRKGEGYHHFMPSVDDMDTAIQTYQQVGCEIAFTAEMEKLGRVIYLDGTHNFGGFIEIIEPSEHLASLTQFLKESARNWNGEDPIRQFPSP